MDQLQFAAHLRLAQGPLLHGQEALRQDVQQGLEVAAARCVETVSQGLQFLLALRPQVVGAALLLQHAL